MKVSMNIVHPPRKEYHRGEMSRKRDEHPVTTTECKGHELQRGHLRQKGGVRQEMGGKVKENKAKQSITNMP